MTQRYISTKEDQTATISINGRAFKFRFFAFRGIMYVDISDRGEYVVRAKRVIANQWLIPEYVANESGNIRFETYSSDSDDYVWHEQFNTKFRLVSYKTAEIEAMEAENGGEQNGE